jgi:hypothetical protein
MELGNVTALGSDGAARMRTPRDLKEASRDFAALFCQKLLATGWNGQGYLSGGPQAEGFYDLLTWQYARAIAERDGFGVGPMLCRSLGGATKDGVRTTDNKDVSNEQSNGATVRA